MAAKKGGKPMVVIRKEEVVEGGHHGGAWKVAYADFVTAMMAFFLLMWLLNATTEEQRKGLADYFSPNNILAHNNSGFGQPFGGTTPNIDGSMASDKGAVRAVNTTPHPFIDAEDDEGEVQAQNSNRQTERGPSLLAAGEQGQKTPLKPGQSVARFDIQPPGKPTQAEFQAEAQRRERAAFERAAEQIREAVRQDPSLAEVAKQLAIDITPEGLRIQIMDDDRRPMFPTGSAVLNDRARALLAKVAPVLMRLPEPIAIAGHTDAAPYRGGERSNWDLSADRANATRRLLVDSGLQEDRMRSVSGSADRDLLIKDDPLAAGNRRIAIMVLHAPAVFPATGAGPLRPMAAPRAGPPAEAR